MRVRKDIVHMKSARQLLPDSHDHDIWHTCPLCGHENLGMTLRAKHAGGDKRFCAGCDRHWFDRYILLEHGHPRYRYLTSIFCDIDHPGGPRP